MIRRSPLKRSTKPLKRSRIKAKRRPRIAPKDAAFLAWVHTLPCAADGRHDAPCGGMVEAHHAGIRGLGRRAPHRTAIPLCSAHHDRGAPFSVHVLGKRFWEFYGLDRETLIADLNRVFDLLNGY